MGDGFWGNVSWKVKAWLLGTVHGVTDLRNRGSCSTSQSRREVILNQGIERGRKEEFDLQTIE